MDAWHSPTFPVSNGDGVGANDRQVAPRRVAWRVSVLAVCVAAYRRHRDGGTGTCAACGAASPCRPRRNAVTVIEAHADDPRRYDAVPDRFAVIFGVALVGLGVLLA